MARIDVGDKAPEFDLEGTGAAPTGSTTVAATGWCSPSTPATSRRSARASSARTGTPRTGWMSSMRRSGGSHRSRSTRTSGSAAKYGLTVPLLADPDRDVIRAYGVLGPGGLVRRSIFIVDPGGHRPVPARRAARAPLPGRRGPRSALAGRRPLAGSHLTATVAPIEPAEFAVERQSRMLAGEALGEGPPIVLLHGITATRRYVVHGSKVLSRARIPTAHLRRARPRSLRSRRHPKRATPIRIWWRTSRSWSERSGGGAGASSWAATRWAPTPRSPTPSNTPSGSRASW